MDAETVAGTVRTCVATAEALPVTGGDDAVLGWWALAAAVAIGVGIVVVLVRRRGIAAGAAVVVAVALAVAASVMTPSPAHADTGHVTYEGECTLVEIDPASVHRADPATLGGLLPGDVVDAVTVVVQNSSATPLTLTADVDLNPAIFGPALSAVALVDGVAAPAELDPGERATVTLTVRLADDTDDTLQGRSAPLRLVLTATQR